MQNIPVVSWLVLGGSARTAGTPIRRALSAGRAAHRRRFRRSSRGSSATACLALAGIWCFTWLLIALTFIDVDTSSCRTSSPTRSCGSACCRASRIPCGRRAPRRSRRRQHHRRGRGYLQPLERLLALQAPHGQGRHGLRRLQAVRRAWRVARAGRCCCPSSCSRRRSDAVVGLWILCAAAQGNAARRFAFGPFLAIAGWLILMVGPRRRRPLLPVRDAVAREIPRLQGRAHRRHRERQDHGRQPLRRAGRAHRRHRRARARSRRARPAAAGAKWSRTSAPASSRPTAASTAARCARACSRTRPSGAGSRQRTHPAIRALDGRALRTRRRGPTRSSPFRCWSETGGAARFDRVLVVDCDPELQMRAAAGARWRHARNRRAANAGGAGLARGAARGRRRRDPQRRRTCRAARSGGKAARRYVEVANGQSAKAAT